VLAVADAESGMQALQSGSVDLLALSLPSLRWQVRQLDQTALTHQIVELSDVRPGYPAFAFALENTAFKTRVDGALSSYIGSPAHVRLVQTYGFEWSDVVWPTPSEAFQE
jgi:polar amino acid transport system substrate-binding protein